MTLKLVQLRVIVCDAPGCDTQVETEASESTAARLETALLGWGYRPTTRVGPKKGSTPRADFCPVHVGALS